jgi:hypothetical protein
MDSRQLPRPARTPPTIGLRASPTVRTAPLRPMAAARSTGSSYRSPIMTMARFTSPAPPKPCSRRAATRTRKLPASMPARPPRPNRTRQGRTTARRPRRSDASPMMGATTTPGMEAAATMRPSPPSLTSRSSAMSGSAGETIELAMMPIRVMAAATRVSVRPSGREGARGTLGSAPHFPERDRPSCTSGLTSPRPVGRGSCTIAHVPFWHKGFGAQRANPIWMAGWNHVSTSS